MENRMKFLLDEKMYLSYCNILYYVVISSSPAKGK